MPSNLSKAPELSVLESGCLTPELPTGKTELLIYVLLRIQRFPLSPPPGCHEDIASYCAIAQMGQGLSLDCLPSFLPSGPHRGFENSCIINRIYDPGPKGLWEWRGWSIKRWF